jgi:hypothetical protein
LDFQSKFWAIAGGEVKTKGMPVGLVESPTAAQRRSSSRGTTEIEQKVEKRENASYLVSPRSLTFFAQGSVASLISFDNWKSMDDSHWLPSLNSVNVVPLRNLSACRLSRRLSTLIPRALARSDRS